MNYRLVLVALLALAVSAWAQPATVEWKTLETGFGEAAKLGDTIAITYILTLPDGTVADQTPESSSFNMEIGSGKVIPGLSEGLTGIKRGERRKIVVPPSLGYGSRTTGPIPANSTLTFEVELRSFVHDHEHTHGDAASQFGEDGERHQPHSSVDDKPAIHEYLIRDFFTRPWRYDDAPQRLWRESAILGLLTLVIGFIGWLRGRRRRTRS